MPRAIPRLLWPTTVTSLAICSATIVVAYPAYGQQPEFSPEVVINRVFPTITNPPTLPADKAAAKVKDNELVLGVTVGDQSRAYPINMLTGPRREIINDRLGNRDIAATW
jgi:hypothetical protein